MLAKVEDNARVVKEAVDKWGRLDGLVLNAAILEPIGMSLIH
jgi:NAD(P)-dependent dehydrogenase (short-subunit alcohol dehydrogenase family)